MRKSVVIMMLCLTLIATVCQSANEGERGVANVKDKVSDVAEGVLNEANDKRGTCTDWALTKITLGLDMDDKDEAKGSAHKAVDKAGDAVSKSTSTLNSAAYESSKYVSDKTGEVGGEASDKAHQAVDMADDATQDANEKAHTVHDYITNLADEALAKVQAVVGVFEDIGKLIGKIFHIF